MLLTDRVALVTGAGSGLGRAIAEAFHREGAFVAINDMNAEAAEAVCRGMPIPSRCIALPADIRIVDELPSMIERCIDKFGKLDVLVNNAGVSPAGLVKTHTLEDWLFAFDTNLKGTLLATQAAYPYLIRSPYGRVINISSEIAEHGMMFQAAYASSKGGISALTKALARTLGKHNVTVNAICPGVIPETNLVKAFTSERPEYADILQFYQDMCPLPIKAHVWNVANVAVSLASDHMSFMNGQLLTVNGGTS